jgi:hypothetical protein
LVELIWVVQLVLGRIWEMDDWVGVDGTSSAKKKFGGAQCLLQADVVMGKLLLPHFSLQIYNLRAFQGLSISATLLTVGLFSYAPRALEAVLSLLLLLYFPSVVEEPTQVYNHSKLRADR